MIRTKLGHFNSFHSELRVAQSCNSGVCSGTGMEFGNAKDRARIPPCRRLGVSATFLKEACSHKKAIDNNFGRRFLKKLKLFAAGLAILFLSTAASAQQIDLAFGVNALTSPSGSSATGNYSPQMLGGGASPSFSGDFLFKHQFGVQGEVAWRASQNVGFGFQPFRPILYDINGIWAPRFGKRAGAELMAGFGGESIRFYTPYVNCSFTGCTDYVSSQHLLGHVGGGLKFYVTRTIFVRPEVHAYFIRNNFEFSSPRAFREGVSIGYTFRPED
jgi:hypothetical protein